MAHLVLARKYRPQRFADVAGQQHVTVTLMNALTQGRIAHGYIFSGHRGIGKTTIARILAMALNCRNAIGSEIRPTAEPCETCESCVEIRIGNAVDVIEIDAATNRGIDEIRELRDAARYRPSRDKYKIYILDEAHQITDAAFNALLKTLEEPPEHIVFMMATTQPEDIPQTVRSRCQHFSFHAVKMADILKELRGIAEQEDVTADEGALSLLAEAGDGSMRDALSIMDQAIASAPSEGGRPRLDAAQIRELMGSVSNAVFERILDAVDDGRTAEVITVANELLDAGNSSSQLARQCVRYLRNCLMAKISGLTPENLNSDDGAGQLLQTSPDEQRRAARTAGKFTEEELTRFLQVMLRTFDELGYRQEQRFHFELGLIKLVHLRRLLPLEEVLSRFPNSSQATADAAGHIRSGNPAQGSSAIGIASPGSGRTSPSAPSVQPATTSAKAAVLSPFQQSTLQRAPASTAGNSRVPSRPQGDVSAAAPRTETQVAPAMNSSVPTSEIAAEQPARGGTPSATVLETTKDSVAPPSEIVTPLPAEISPVSVQQLREAAGRALSGAKSQGSAADALDDAEWTTSDGSLRIQTALSPTMLPMVLNAEAEKILRSALRDAGIGSLRVELLPGAPRAQSEAKKPRRGRDGSAQAKAEQHPIVQQAQRLFHAEIRNVIDLTEGK